MKRAICVLKGLLAEILFASAAILMGVLAVLLIWSV